MLSDLGNVLNTILDAYPAGAIVAFDRDLRYVFAGGEGLAETGLVPEEMIGRTPLELFPDAFGDITATSYQRCVDGERFEETLDFRTRVYRVIYTPVVSNDVVIGGLVVTLDQTPALMARAARDIATARYETFIQAFPGVAVLFDAEANYLVAGGTELDAFGWTAEQIQGRVPEDLLEARAAAWVRRRVARALAEGEVVSDVTTRRGRIYEVRFVAIEGEEQPTVIAMALDVHEQRLAQQRIEEDLLRKEALLKEVHHRVKNHLQVVQSLLGMTARRVESATAQRALTDVRERVQAMAVVHAELYRRTDTSRVELHRFLERLLAQLRRGLPRLGRVRVVADFEAIEADNTVALHLGLVLTELVANAAAHAFAAGPGELRIGLARCGDQLELLVQDDGPGLPGELDIGDSLGLWLVHTLTEPRGGEVIEDGGGSGARWRVRIPVGDDALAPVSADD